MTQVDAEETPNLVETEDYAPLGDGGGGLFGQAPRGLHGCAAAVPSKQNSSKSPNFVGGAGRGGRSKGSPSRGGAPSGSPEDYDGVRRRGSMRSQSPVGMELNAGGRMLKRFRTKVCHLIFLLLSASIGTPYLS